MTIEIGTTEPANAGMDLSAAKLAFLEAVRTGQAGLPLLRTMLGNAKLSTEQQAFVDLLEAESKKTAAADEDEDEETSSQQELRQELADLREANDTVAAALGACPICWGGDRSCDVCRGRGRAGFRPPDPDLFDELVVPAVQRARAMVRTGSRRRHG
jgi:hypothetical protein